ncbi:MAG: hypothetical protein WBN92_17235 [Terriglobia bacterium]
MREVCPIPSPWDSRFLRRRFFRTISLVALSLGLLAVSPLLAAEKNPNPLRQIEQNVREGGNLLDSVDKDLRANQFTDVQKGLRQYQGLLESTESNTKEYLQVHRKTPHQFKDFEIKLRKQLRKLQDLRPEFPIPLRESLDAVIEHANKVRKQFMGNLFDEPSRLQPKNDAKKDL